MPEMIIQSHRGPYTVRFGSAFDGLKPGLAKNQHLIIDRHVAQLYREALAVPLAGDSVLVVEATEQNKSLEKFSAYARHLIERGLKRDHVLIAVGGGIIQDITAFLATVMLRGVAWKYYPTTLLAQADSCIGSKSSVNVGPFKNQLGTFNPPVEIMLSIDMLKTLNEAQLRSGIGEMIKVHVISGWEDVRAIAKAYSKIVHDKALMERFILRSLEIKKERIEADEFDRNERLVMNYGHSFGHAIESATNYAVPHGIAVTIGMDMANFISCRMGFIKAAVYDELHLLLASNYAGYERVPIPEDTFFSALAKDKKSTSTNLSVILMRGPGRVFRSQHPKDGPLQALCREYLNVFLGRTEEALCLSK